MKSLDVLMKRVQEAIALCLEVEVPTMSDFVGVQRVADVLKGCPMVPKVYPEYFGIFL